MNLRIPGPTPLPPSVREALSKQMISHRSPEFAALQERIVHRLRSVFQTQGDILLLASSGTGGLEASVVNLISPGDKVLALSIGFFGDRFADIAEAFGAELIRVNFPLGQAVDLEVLDQLLAANPELKLVLVTHNETSTGVTNPLKEIAQAVKERSHALLGVDAISSIGSIPLAVDAWRCDVVVTGSQKSWMIPPGMAMVSVSPAAWEATRRAQSRRFYWDFAKMREAMAKGQTPFTPSIALYYALDEALRLMEEEGWDHVIARHRWIADHTRAGVKALGLELLADEAYASNTVTAIRTGAAIDAEELRAVLRDEYQVLLGGGFGELRGKIVRIGHLGYVSQSDIDDCLEAMEKALAKLRSRVKTV